MVLFEIASQFFLHLAQKNPIITITNCIPLFNYFGTTATAIIIHLHIDYHQCHDMAWWRVFLSNYKNRQSAKGPGPKRIQKYQFPVFYRSHVISGQWIEKRTMAIRKKFQLKLSRTATLGSSHIFWIRYKVCWETTSDKRNSRFLCKDAFCTRSNDPANSTLRIVLFFLL